MGLFSRNESSGNSSNRRSGQRGPVSSEAQAAELRGRARRRLIGALALVVAAVIVVPMMVDTKAPPTENATPIVVPSIVPPAQVPQIALGQSGAVEPASGSVTSEPVPAPDDSDEFPPAADAGQIATLTPVEPAAPETPAPAEQKPATPSEPAAKPEKPEQPEKPAQPKPSAKPATEAVERTDDGSVAIALLEGRKPQKPAAATTRGNYVLQIAAYTSDKDAQSRRERLVSSGVTNAYVEAANSGGKSTYRLRVGPFPSREAAQAAQARLRALGYDNGFISSK